MVFAGLMLCLASLSSGARILAWYAMPAKSHHIAFQPILRALAERGHKIDFYTTITMKDPPANIRVIELPSFMSAGGGPNLNFKEFGDLASPLVSTIMYKMGMGGNDMIASSPEFQKLMSSDEKYDLVLGEFLFVNENSVALMHKFKVPGIATQPLGDCAWVNEIAGLPDNPSYMVDWKSLFTGRMNFFQRLYNAYTTVITNVVSYYFVTFPLQAQMDRMFNYTGWETRPRLPMLMSDLALILVNTHHSVGYPYPKAPHVKEVGGAFIGPNKPLPKDLQTYLDAAKEGVIYFSLGSVVDPVQFVEDGSFVEFVNAFKKLKQNILWKWRDGVELPKVEAPNIKFSPWVPQQDVLAHNKTILFVTHGGLLSMMEAVHFGVPLVGIGVFGDQRKNVEFMNAAGFGVGLDVHDLKEPTISKAINEVLNDPKYRTEMLRRQALFTDRPMKPLDEAVYWVEYVLKHGKALQPASARMPFYQLYMLDIFAALGAVLLLAVNAVRKLACALLSLCCGKAASRSTIESKKKR
ncbi:unnamed protein product [Nesidiocoris tenuis]|uniref:Glucuronosyltransferase n=1 Tax=Nesidiocoris tenuis TaxID=355587 RepID=A0A6H5HNS7_9HEMI|nr:unnamed protein product [Nesidiocoris tenuis]